MNLNDTHAAAMDAGQLALMTAMEKVRKAVGGKLRKTESAPVGKGESQRTLKYINREKVLAALMPHCEKNGLTLYFTGGDNPAPHMIRQMLVVVGLDGAHKGARLVFSQDYPVTPAAGVQGAQYVGATQTYASARLMAQAFALELSLEKDPDSLSDPEDVNSRHHSGPTPKCHCCGKEMRESQAKKTGNWFWACPERKFSDATTAEHSAVSSDKLVLVGADGNWEEKK